MKPANAERSLSDQYVEQKPALLLIDDDPIIVETLSFVLEDEFKLYRAATRERAKAMLYKLRVRISLALVDLGLPPTPHAPDEGFELISELIAYNPFMKILVLSGQNSRANIQHALTLGAVDFVPKPCDAALLKSRLKHQIMMLEAEHQDREAEGSRPELLGKSPAMVELRKLIRQFADTPFPVLIEGESGSGKELVIEQLHRSSKRARQPLLTLNCAAFPADLLEAQLFGHAKGAFTGAITSHKGFFEEADGGTLFLDEIGEMPVQLQAKLLRVLENGEYYRIGETAAQRSKARVLTATNRYLPAAVQAGKFRQDLYHRLSVLTIKVPPLRARGDDCLLLLEYFKRLYAASFAPFSLNKAAEECLRNYSFPGNVRELRNIVIRLGAKHPGASIDANELMVEMESEPATASQAEITELIQMVEQALRSEGFRLDDTLNDWERRYISEALKRCGGNLSKAARLLGVNRSTLYSKMQRLSLEGTTHVL